MINLIMFVDQLSDYRLDSSHHAGGLWADAKASLWVSEFMG